MLKRLSLWLCTSLFVIAALGLIISATVVSLVQPGKVKTWVDKSGAYTELPSALITEASMKQNQEGNSGVSFDNPLVRTAASSALTQNFLRSSTETVIDSIFRWLNGESKVPDFVVNVGSTKQAFVDNLGDALTKRYEALPLCAGGSLPTTADPFTIDCQVTAGIDFNAIVADQKQQLLANKDFLPEARLTADNLARSSDNARSIFEEMRQVAQAYQAAQILPFVLAGIVLITAIGTVLLSKTKRSGLHKLGWRFTILGILSLIATGLGYLGLTQTKDLATNQSQEAMATIYKNILAQGIEAVRLDLLKTGLIVGGSVLLLGLILLLITRASKEAKSTKVTPKTNQTKTPKTATESKINEVKPTSATPSLAAVPKQPKPKPRPKRRLIQ